MMNADRNNIELCGRLVRDIKLSENSAGIVYGIITIVTRTSKTDAKKAEFFEIFIWNQNLIDSYGPYLNAGKRVLVCGSLSKHQKNIYINVTADYGLMVCLDIRDLKQTNDKGDLWIKKLEEENKSYAEKLKTLEEKQ